MECCAGGRKLNTPLLQYSISPALHSSTTPFAETASAGFEPATLALTGRRSTVELRCM